MAEKRGCCMTFHGKNWN